MIIRSIPANCRPLLFNSLRFIGTRAYKINSAKRIRRFNVHKFFSLILSLFNTRQWFTPTWNCQRKRCPDLHCAQKGERQRDWEKESEREEWKKKKERKESGNNDLEFRVKFSQLRADIVHNPRRSRKNIITDEAKTKTVVDEWGGGAVALQPRWVLTVYIGRGWLQGSY